MFKIMLLFLLIVLAIFCKKDNKNNQPNNIKTNSTHSKSNRHSAYTNTTNCSPIALPAGHIFSLNCQSLDNDYKIWKQEYEAQTWLAIYHLNYSLQIIGSGLKPTTIDQNIEWRYLKNENEKKYYALICRTYLYDENDTKKEIPIQSYFVVVKLNKQHSCIVAKINANQRNAERKARLVADLTQFRQLKHLDTMEDKNAEPKFRK